MKLGWIVMLAFITAPGSTSSQTPDEAFTHGNELYRAGNYREAARQYEGILKSGYVSPEVYFNLGNSYYRTGELALAILSYERAGLLRPDDPDINHNLRLLYLKTVDRIEPVPEMFLVQWIRIAGSWLSPDTARTIFLAGWILLFCALTAMYLTTHPSVIRIARIAFFGAFILTILFAGMLGLQTFQDSSRNKAIITAQTVTAKTSPDTQGVDAFVIHEGLKVKLADAVGDWVKITLADGKVGWILSNQCERI